LGLESFRPLPAGIAVIIGQDPYHGHGQAHGLCFSVEGGVKIPPSLRNIFKELHNDVGTSIPEHGSLIPWARQGVLLLNATLTVREGEAKSHYGKGWERLTDAIVAALVERKDPVVFVLWGKSAEEKYSHIQKHGKGKGHVILKAAHPSPLSVRGFWGCRHFSKINETLELWGKEPIDWSLG
jgi:uracil-DNA glycosylase